MIIAMQGWKLNKNRWMSFCFFYHGWQNSCKWCRQKIDQQKGKKLPQESEIIKTNEKLEAKWTDLFKKWKWPQLFYVSYNFSSILETFCLRSSSINMEQLKIIFKNLAILELQNLILQVWIDA